MESRRLLIWSLYQLFRPIARMALRQGLSARDAGDILKQAFVDVAREDHGIRGRPTNKSRVAALTGLTRAEVARLTSDEHPKLGEVGGRHPLQRIIKAWLQRRPWCNAQGDPAPLPINDGDDSFAALVQETGGGLPYQTVLRELTRLALVEDDGESVHLLKRGFVPAGPDVSALIPFVGENAGAHLDTLEFNLRGPDVRPRFERKVVFPGLDETGLRRLAEIAEQRGQQLLEFLNAELTPHTAGDDSGRLTGLGIYAFDFTPS